MPARLITQEEYQELVQQGVLRDVLVILTPQSPGSARPQPNATSPTANSQSNSAPPQSEQKSG
jgi:hypothetical protein